MNVVPCYSGFLIAIEGIDGGGKSTQAQMVQERLEARNLRVLRTREPTTGQWGRILRESALTGRLSIEEEAETFMKDRREHVETEILPALREGAIVIVDRYYFSTAAYQGARGLDPQDLIRRNEEFAPEPDLLVLLDVEVTQGLDRVRTRGHRADHFEQIDNLRRAREIFLGIEKPYLLKIDARQDAQEICAPIVREFSVRYQQRIMKCGLAMKDDLSEALRDFAGSAPN
ncbi:MAG TPA: dTMP kinase [Methylomirabilota bacterium]|nr:dTMP kinase [Methylomirabilota bacterium]